MIVKRALVNQFPANGLAPCVDVSATTPLRPRTAECRLCGERGYSACQVRLIAKGARSQTARERARRKRRGDRRRVIFENKYLGAPEFNRVCGNAVPIRATRVRTAPPRGAYHAIPAKMAPCRGARAQRGKRRPAPRRIRRTGSAGRPCRRKNHSATRTAADMARASIQQRYKAAAPPYFQGVYHRERVDVVDLDVPV